MINMTVNLENTVGPIYQRLKSHIIARIKNGDWPPAHQLPSENELVNSLQVSRMTVNRALRELANEGYLTRIPGVGTFVAEIHSRSHFLEINTIADEVRERMHDYSAKVILNKRVRLSSENAERIRLPQGSYAFHSTIVHEENHIPIQVEDRYVNPEVVPGYGEVDFTRTTPTEYLLKTAPLQEVEHTVRRACLQPSGSVAVAVERKRTLPGVAAAYLESGGKLPPLPRFIIPEPV